MKNGTLRDVMHFIHHSTPPGRIDDAPDGQLLERFIDQRDEMAFATLLRRHGPLVLGVCRRLLPCAQDAEDAFQATFLVLARNAGSIAKHGSVASWLYGVAHRIARRAKADISKRRLLERRDRPLLAPDALQDLVWQDLRAILDEEVSRLPEKYRAAFILCYMEGTSNEEAARLLGCPRGTISSRLVRARAILRARLTQRGLALSAGFIATMLAEKAIAAAVPGKLAAATVRGAVQVAAGQLADAGFASAQVISLMEGGRMMTKIKMAAALLLPLGIVVAGTGALALTNEPAEPVFVAQDKPKPTASADPEKSAPAPRPPERTRAEPPMNPAEKYLQLCEKELMKLNSFAATVQRTSTDKTFGVSEVYDGTVKYLKPDMSLLEMHKKNKVEVFEKYLRAGPVLYDYNPVGKTVIVHHASTSLHSFPRWFGTLFYWFFEPGAFPFSLLMKAEEIKGCCDCKLVKEDQWYLYIELIPRTPAAKADFRKARLVLLKETHLPREFWFEQPNGNDVKWDIPKIAANVPLRREEFTKPQIPAGWELVRVPPFQEELLKKKIADPKLPSK